MTSTRTHRSLVLGLTAIAFMLAQAVPGRVAADTGAVTAPAAVKPVATIKLIGVTHWGSETNLATEYPLRRLRNLKIVVWWTVRGAHTQRIHLRAPDGSLYQRLVRPFDTATSVVTNYGTPVEVVLPVGGTWMTEYSLVGDWQIQVYLDDSRKPAATRLLRLKN